MVGGFSPHLFRRHVPGSTHHHARLCAITSAHNRSCFAGGLLLEFGQAKIQNFEPAIFSGKKIFRLQVAMDDSFLVRCSQSSRNLRGLLDSLARWQRSAPDLFTQRFTLK